MTRTPDELDMPLAQQLRLRGKTSQRAPLPAATNLVLESPTLPWVVRVKPRGVRIRDVVAMIALLPCIAFPALVPAAVISAIAFGKPNDSTLPLALVITAASWWYLGWRSMLRGRSSDERIHLSPTGIRAAWRSPGWHDAGALMSDQIEEVIVIGHPSIWLDGNCVVARGDGVSIVFGRGLTRDDALWLRDAAIAALAPRSIYR